MKQRLVVFLSVLFCLTESSLGQESVPATEVFSKSVRFYQAGQYDSTIACIRDFLKDHGKDPEAEVLVPLIMEAFLREGEYRSVKRLFDLYQKKFRSSPFMPRVHYLRGYAIAKEQSYAPAIESFSRALSGGVSDDLDTLILRGTEALCANAMSLDELRDVATEAENNERLREVAAYYEIKKLISAGDMGRARNSMSAFKNQYPRSRFAVEIGDLLAVGVPKKTVTIGLLAPLTGDDAEAGIRVAQGVKLAIDRHNRRSSMQIRLLSCDTKGDLLETARQTALLVDRDKVPLIIGPVLSSTATVTAAMLAKENTVMLTPTATDDGIAALGPHILQMNITLGVLARKVARYALENLNIREFAIVSPRSPYGAAIAAIFKDEVVKRGGTVFHEDTFDEGSNNYSAQFIALRKKLLVRKLNELDGKAREKLSISDSVKWIDTSVSIGAIFMPAEADDIVMLAPQVSFNRIKAQLLGSSGWHTAKTVAEGKQYVRNAILSTTFEPDSAWKKWPDFKREYAAAWNQEPDRVAALGYDAGSLVATALENAGARAGASRIAELIADAAKYEGVAGVITFDRNTRTNTEAVILKLTANGFVRVQ